MNANISLSSLYVYHPDLFKDLQLPDGVDKDILIDRILMDTMELELLYPDPDFLQDMIRIWSRAELPVWKKMQATLELDYNPIWNKDGTITTETSGNYTDNGTSTGSVKGFNSDSWAEHDRMQSNRSGDSGGLETRRETGNIGVTTTQQMIREERDISEFNIYGYISDSFKNRFCLMIY